MKRIKLIANAELDMKRLDRVLGEWLPHALGRPVSKAKVRKLIFAGAVYLNGRAVRNASKTVVSGDTVEAKVDLARLFEAFRIIAEYPRGLWVQANPKTGRTHQVRVHLSEYGLPIFGDETYGAEHGVAPRLMLHAAELIFPHPMTGRELSIKSDLPPDFERCLAELRKIAHDH